jgi:uncharacterized protein (DUF1697 family)
MPNAPLTRYVAFLRGINVGGRTVKMDALRRAFTRLGFKQVKTLIASGNVSFYAPRSDPKKLAAKVEAALTKRFAFHIPVIVRTARSLESLVASRPFASVRVTPATRLWITLLGDLDRPSARTHDLHENMQIAGRTRTEVLFVLTAGGGFGGPLAMELIEEHFGKNVTTRTWNTIERLLAL